MHRSRCEWANCELYAHYHDSEWGRPEHNDDKLFEMLSLEWFQAGLSWITILKKRENFRLAFDYFKPQKVALYDEKKIDELMANSGIVRHRAKIQATISNARLFLQVQREFVSFDKFIWRYVKFTPILGGYSGISQVPSKSEISLKMSKDLTKLGFKFVGPTIIYSFMQAAGMVNDHTKSCFMYQNNL